MSQHMRISMVLVAIAGALPLCHCGVLLTGNSYDDDAGEAGADQSFGDGSSGSSEGGTSQVDGDVATDGASSGAPVTDSAKPSDGSCTKITHSNGVGQSYQSCEPLSPIGVNAAGLACKAYADSIPQYPGTCRRDPPGCPCPNPADCGSSSVVLGFVYPGQPTIVWDFAGAAMGHVVSGANRCPTTSDPVWN